MTTSDTKSAQAAGRGGIAIAIAKISFILFSFIQQLILPRLIGIAGYGEVAIVLGVVGIVNNVIIATSIQGVSRTLLHAPSETQDAVFGRTLMFHTLIATITSLTFAICAPWIAEKVGAPHVVNTLRLVSLVIFTYGLYGPLVGSLNGRKRFVDQAGLDIFYSILRTIGIITCAYFFAKFNLGGGVGVIAGFAIASTLIVPIAITRSGIGKWGGSDPTLVSYLSFFLPLALGQVFLNLLLQTDSILLSRYLGNAAATAGLATQAADELRGVYRGVQLFGFLPYQILISITFVLFPMLAQAKAQHDVKAIRNYTSSGIRLGLLITGLMSGTISSLAPHVLRFAFPAVIAENGGDALRIFALGMGTFAVFGIICAALTSLGSELLTMATTAFAVAMIALFCSLWIPAASFGPPMLIASAKAASVGLTLATIVGAFLLYRVAGAFTPLITILRVVGAMVALQVVGRYMPWIGKVGLLAEVAFVAGLYIVLLVLCRELKQSDLQTFTAPLRRRKTP